MADLLMIRASGQIWLGRLLQRVDYDGNTLETEAQAVERRCAEFLAHPFRRVFGVRAVQGASIVRVGMSDEFVEVDIEADQEDT